MLMECINFIDCFIGEWPQFGIMQKYFFEYKLKICSFVLKWYLVVVEYVVEFFCSIGAKKFAVK